MSARAASSALILSLLIAPGFFRSAQAGPWLPAPGEYYTELRGGLFTAKTYHDDAGDRVGLGGTWEERSLLGTVELGWKKRLSVVMSAPFVSATSLRDGVSVTSTGIEDIHLGARLGLKQGTTALALQADWQAPSGYSLDTSLFADPMRGGGLQQLGLSLLYGAPLAGRGFVQFGAGYDYRYYSFLRPSGKNASSKSQELWATSFLPSADVGIWISKSLLLGGRYAGAVTATSGALYPEHRDVHRAGLALLWRVDDRLDLTAGSWTTSAAKDFLHYDQVYVALTFKQTKLNRLQGFLGGTKAP
jgi:hypothetical protein